MKIRDRIKELRRVRASELRPHPRNWRIHSESQQNALRGILAEVGIADALLARELPDGSLMLIDGHLRAGVDLETEWPVLVLDVTEEEANLLLATVDPLADMAEADPAKLETLLAEVNTDSDAIQAMLDGLAVEAGIEPEEGDETPDPEPQIDRADELLTEWKVEPGQLWEVPGKAGTHRVLCGDSTKVDDVERVMGGEKAALCFTSPPYLDAREYGGAESSLAALVGFVPACVSACGLIAVNLGILRRENAVIRYWDSYIAAAEKAGMVLLSWNVWDRQQPWSMAQGTAMFPIEHEWVFIFGAKRVALNLTVKNKTPGARMGITNRQPDDSLSHAETKEVRECRPLGTVFRSPPHIGRDIGHPAMFPVALPSAYVAACTQAGDCILDPFLGSGTTLIAAEQLGRICYGIEISPAYTAVILQRATDAGLTPALANE